MLPRENLQSRDDFYERYIPDPPPLDWGRAERTIYEGLRGPEGGAAGVLVDGIPDVLPWRLDLRNRSPTGLEWGYGGSGPHQLAIAILAHVTGDGAYAVAKHHDYAQIGPCVFDSQGFRITGTEVLKWVEANPISKEERFNALSADARSELVDRSVVDDFISECCGADQTYAREHRGGVRRSFAVCTNCGSKNEF